jgi:hypothetical protein
MYVYIYLFLNFLFYSCKLPVKFKAMGAEESKTGNNSEGDGESEEWMQADKYADWTCSDHMDYNGTAITIKHVEMPFNRAERDRLDKIKENGGGDGSSLMGTSPFTHECLVFDVVCLNGMRTKFTVEFTFGGVLKRWGQHKAIFGVKTSKPINVPITEVLKRIDTNQQYNVVLYNCKNYSEDVFKKF